MSTLSAQQEYMNMEFGGRYRPVRRLGAGGTGTVYTAADGLLGRTVALKLLNGAIDPAVLRREAQSLARLQHRNVVVLHDLGEEGGEPYLVLEYVDGTDLGAWLEEHGTPEPEAGLALFAQVARAVAHGHALGVLHCDIKPSNVLISTGGEVKLTDFTLAQLLDHGRFHGARGGTIDYAAPEQLSPGGTVDERTDIYALGVLLQRLTEGRLEGETGEAVRAAIERATQPEPDDRFASVAELMDVLPLPDDATRVVAPARGPQGTRVLPGRIPSADRRFSGVRMAMAGTAGGIAVAAVLAGWTLFAAASPAHVTLPNMVATNAPSAELVARSLDLRYRVERVYSTAAPMGVVVGQQPRAGLSVETRSTVTLIVSKGPKPVVLPALANLSQDDAVSRLHSLGFKVVVQTSDTIFSPAGIVLDQSPAANAELIPGTTVTITVSTRPWWAFW